MLRIERVARMGYGGFLMLEYQNRQPPHPIHTTLCVFVAVATSVSRGARANFKPRYLASSYKRMG